MVTAFAALIFSGLLAGYVSQGSVFILFGAVIIGRRNSHVSSYAGTVRVHTKSPQPSALVASMIATTILPREPWKGPLSTLVAVIIITSLSTGLYSLCLASLRPGNIDSAPPFPVIGGFSCGTGLLLMKGAFRCMTGKPFTSWRFSTFFNRIFSPKWLPGLLLAVTLFLIPALAKPLPSSCRLGSSLPGAFLLNSACHRYPTGLVWRKAGW